ncbi:MAG TPA: DUF2892 domain-containing protein [Nitrospiria bacterium]|nr:DUF2892 domain-containing protein [Nitrospiria bacterium]
MKSNIGNTEKWVRLAVGTVLVLTGIFGGLPTWGMATCIGFGAIAIITGAINFCPIWSILGINTRKA